MRDNGLTIEPMLFQHELNFVEEIDHNINTLKNLMSQLNVIRKGNESFLDRESGSLRVPTEVVRFHARKELMQTERQIRTAIGGIFGGQSPEFRQNEHLRIGVNSNSAIPAAIRLLEDLTFRLEEKRLQCLSGQIRSTEDVPDLDPLTDLYGRRLFYRYFNHELERSKRQDYTAVLVYFALTNWQDVSSLHGLKAWEEVLIGMSCACKAALRGYDYAGRISEYEFALLLPQSETQGAHAVIRRIVEQFHRAMKRSVPDPKVSLEFGTAAFPFDGDTLSALFDVATDHRVSFTEDLKSFRAVPRRYN